MAAETETETNQAENKVAAEKESSTEKEGGDVSVVLAETKNVKHPLQNEWVLWYLKPDRAKNWNECLLKVSQFKFVEDFWALYNHIELASNLSNGCDYNIFKTGIEPMWEDDRNKKGGRWLFVLQKSKGQSKALDELWLEVLLCIIGEAFGEDSDQICGAVINVRPKMDKISVWTSDCNDQKAVLNIGRVLKSRTNVTFPINYESHAATQVKQGSVAKPLYQI